MTAGLWALQTGLSSDNLLQLAAQLLGLGIASGTAAGLVAVSYRWYVRERVPTGLGILFGLSVVAVYLGTTGALGAVISGQEAVLESSDVLPNLSAFAVGAAGSSLGIRVGDSIGTDLFVTTGGRTVNADVSEVVQTVGRVTSIRLPEEIDDIVGYDPMPDQTKATLADRRFLFPRRLTKNDLRDRLISRLKTDYGVGHVDLELGADGNVEYLAIGSRAAGIGPTLPPATNAVAIRADPANAASSGDLVQVWQPDPFKRVLTGELRGVAGDVVTVAIDASDTPRLDPTTEYKLVTLPVQDRPDREFASLLRAADETMGTIPVPPGSELAGVPIGGLGVTVAAITREDGQAEPIPSRGRELAVGDVIYAIAKPDALRRVENTASRQRTEPVAVTETDETEPTDGSQTGGPEEATGDSTEQSGPDAGTAGAEPDDADGKAKAREGNGDRGVGDDDVAAADENGITETEATDEAGVTDESDEAQTGADSGHATESEASPKADTVSDDSELVESGAEPADTEAESTTADASVREGDDSGETDEGEPIADIEEGPTDEPPTAIEDVELDEPAPESGDTESPTTESEESVTMWDPDERLEGELDEGNEEADETEQGDETEQSDDDTRT